jgi:predicted transcriptional regulator
MEEIERLLKLFGLNDKETKVYIACMQLGQDTAYNIAEKSGVKRATTYLILRSLVKKSLVTTHITAKSFLYGASSPQNLVMQLDHRKNELEQSLPLLLALYNTHPEKPTIEVFEGSDGVKQIYTRMIDNIKKSQEILLYGDVGYFIQNPSLLKSWQREARAAEAPIRELLNNDAANHQYQSRIAENGNPRHQIKFLPQESPLLNDNLIFGDELVIFSTQKHFFATVFKSKEVAASYRVIFNLVWESRSQ